MVSAEVCNKIGQCRGCLNVKLQQSFDQRLKRYFFNFYVCCVLKRFKLLFERFTYVAPSRILTPRLSSVQSRLSDRGRCIADRNAVQFVNTNLESHRHTIAITSDTAE